MKPLTLFFLMIVGLGVAQDQKPPTRVFHVTSVKSGDATDWCTTGLCAAGRITVEGYTLGNGGYSVEYVLECVETAPTPLSAPDFKRTVCSRVHSNEEYEIKLGGTGICFVDDPQTKSDSAYHACYTITSEKEVMRHKK